MLENPPTKKKSGITWSTQVASQTKEVTPSTLRARISPSSQKMTPTIQWPNTTLKIETARSRSM